MPTYLDLGAIGIVLVTALLSMMWGLKRSVLAIGSFATAQAATGYLYPYVFLFLNPYFSENSLANVASLAAVFFVVLIALLLLTVRIYAFLDPKIGALDRSLGLVFGAAFSFLYVVAAFFMFSFLVGERHQPEWVRNAKTRVVLIETADRIIAMLPASDAATTIEGWISSKTSPSPTPSKATTRSEIDKQKLDSIINKLPGAAPNKP